MGQRTRHEGTIYQHASGRWAGTLSLGRRPDGRRARRTVYGSSVAEVRVKLGSLRAYYRDGLSLASERLSVGSYLQSWLQERARVIRPQTYDSYERICRLHLIPALGRIRLEALRPDQIRAMLAAWSASASTVRLRLSILGMALEAATADGLLPRNPAARVQPPAAVRVERRVLTADEARRLLDAASTDRQGALYVLALLCGLRRGELLGLLWDAVDLDAGLLHVRETLQRIDGEYRLLPPKTERSRRTVPLPALAVEHLRAHRARQAEERLACGALWRDSGLLFPGLLGQPMSRGTLRPLWVRFCRAAGLPAVRLHDLRHSCATLLLEQGEHARTVMEVLGHASYGITMDLYGHVRPAVQADAMRRLDERLR